VADVLGIQVPDDIANLPDTAAPTVPDSSNASAGSVATAAAPAKRRGRPPLSAEEKDRRAKERAQRLLNGTGVVADIAKRAGMEPTKVAAAVAGPTPPTKEQIEKARKTLEKTFQFLGDLSLEVACYSPAPSFGKERAADLADAWAEILAENLGENAAEIVKWTTAIAVTGYTIKGVVSDVREHNAKHKPLGSK